MDSNIAIINENNFIIGTVEKGSSIYDYDKCGKVRLLLGIRDNIDLDMLVMLIQNGVVKMDNKTFENCSLTNPIIEQYNDWDKNWRSRSSSNAYTWRINSEKFFSLQKNNVKGTLKDYISYMESLRFISYTEDKPDIVEKINNIKRVSDFNKT